MTHLTTCFFLIYYNEPELGAEIDPGMALTPLPSSIGLELNPRPSDCEPSNLPLDRSPFSFTSAPSVQTKEAPLLDRVQTVLEFVVPVST